jgi:hypothetical protein
MMQWYGKLAASASPRHAQRRTTRSRMSQMVSASPAAATFTAVHHALGVDGGESVMHQHLHAGIVESFQPASDVKPIKMPTLTTRWPEDDLRQLLCQEHFRDADGWSGNRPTEGSCNYEGMSAWATFRPSAAMLVSC